MLLAAGPFSATSAPMVEACLQTGTHYLDITGEIAVLEGLYRRNVEAQQRGCVLLPGVGFDVVPSDCLAVTLKALLPDATSLELAWAGHSSPTRGTATSMLEGLALGGAMRQGGHLCRVPTAWRIRKVPFRDRTRTAVSLPWGDVSSAYYSTGIPSIVVYAALPASAILALRVMRPLVPLLRLKSLHGWLRASIVRHITGPDEQTRRSGRSQLWGRVTDAAGQERSATLETPEAYQLTAITAVECMRRVLAGKVAPGAQTPATAFGADFITSIAGCDLLTS